MTAPGSTGNRGVTMGRNNNQPDLKELAEKLRYYREASALSHRQVADALGIERSTYTKYETGGSRPRLPVLLKIADIFNVPPEALLPDSKHARTSGDVLDSSADSPIYQLSKSERGLVASFRALSDDQKAQALEMIAKLSKKGR